MIPLCRKLPVGLVALCASILTPCTVLSMEVPQPGASNGRVHIPLPGTSDPGQFRWLEWSTNMVDWEPVARDYGFAWQNQFPHTLAVAGQAESQSLVHPGNEPVRYYRIAEAPASTMSNLQLASRFLQQATFGPTRDLLATFPGIEAGVAFNEFPYTYFEQWIDQQINLPMTSLRAFWRERSNPAFVDNTARSPFEVAHNPAHGTQLPYWTGGRNPDDKHLVNTSRAVAAGRPSNDVTFNLNETKQVVWYQAAVSGSDAFRQRMAWSLSQIFVVGESGSVQLNATERFLVYYDIFVRHAFGNFRDILGEVTFNPLMGDYLTYIDNQKADPILGTFPDENYAREVMQLFTIGLWMLNQDGTRMLDQDGNGIPTYDNDDIFEIAKIFTGLRKQYTGRGGNGSRDNIEIKYGNFIDPLRMQANRHDYSAKTLPDGSTLGPYPQNISGGIAEINAFLDFLFNHSNTPPFIARLLIQRLTASNPSPTYIHDVAQAFIDGTYMGKGSGQRGDLTAVFKAILLHPEARETALASDTGHGKLREPLVRLLHYARALEITSIQTFGFFPFWRLDQVIAQSPFDYPSVFNFYLPEFQPLGDILDRGLNSPEFEITTDVTSLGLANAIRTLVHEGIADDIGARSYSQANLNLAHETSLAGNTHQLIDHIDLILTAGRLTPQNRQLLFEIIDPMPFATAANRLNRVRLALSLVSLFPEFNVIN